MFYTLFLLLFLILVMFVKMPENENFIWIVVSLCGLCLALIAFVFYVFNLYECFKIKTLYFDFSDSLWLLMWGVLQKIKLTPFTIYRLMNTGIVFFVTSFLNFICLYTNHSNKGRKIMHCKYFIFPCLFLIVYDPIVMKYLFYIALGIKQHFKAFRFSDYINILNYINKGWIFSYLLLGVYWLYMDYRSLTLKKIKQKTIYVMLCIVPMVGLYMLIFYWFPQQLIVLREAGGNPSDNQQFLYLQFGYGNFIHLPLLYKIYPVITLISVSILLYAAYSRKAFTVAEKSELGRLNYSLEVATLGSRVFTHAVKNDIIAIQILMQKLSGKILGSEATYEEINKINEICGLSLNRMNELKSKINIGAVRVQCVDAKDIIKQGVEKANVPETISVDFNSSSGPVMAYMDTCYFSEVITELIQNAIDAIHMTGREDGYIWINMKQRNKEVFISIKDNGCGINSEKIKSIFDPFYTTKPSAQNWGLGLFFCRMILQIHNGEIHFSSIQSEGSEAEIYLPSAPEAARRKDAG